MALTFSPPRKSDECFLPRPLLQTSQTLETFQGLIYSENFTNDGKT